MLEEEEIVHDICFLAVTRPAMFLGVTVEAFGVVGIVTVVAFVATLSFKALGAGVAVMAVCRALLWNDHNRLRVIAGWTKTRGRMVNSLYWGGGSATPIAVARAKLKPAAKGKSS